MSNTPAVVLVEALLFVVNEPLTTPRLAELTGHNTTEIEAALKQLSTKLSGSGLLLTHHNHEYRLVTAPAAASVIRQYLQAETRSDLSRPALETLAIIAYRGPLTRTQLDEIRGVASDTMLRNLLSRGLITEQGVASEPGQPTLYSVSHTFLQHFGLGSLQDLPPLEETAEA